MKRQTEMVDSFQRTHRDFMKNLNDSLIKLDHDINEARRADARCTGAFCKTIEHSIDELSKNIYSISEPRWVPNADSKQISQMRTRLHDMYTRYRSLGKSSLH